MPHWVPFQCLPPAPEKGTSRFQLPFSPCKSMRAAMVLGSAPACREPGSGESHSFPYTVLRPCQSAAAEALSICWVMGRGCAESGRHEGMGKDASQSSVRSRCCSRTVLTQLLSMHDNVREFQRQVKQCCPDSHPAACRAGGSPPALLPPAAAPSPGWLAAWERLECQRVLVPAAAAGRSRPQAVTHSPGSAVAPVAPAEGAAGQPAHAAPI